MPENIPSRESQDVRVFHSDCPVPYGWLREIDRACTEWLLQRGLLDSLSEPRVDFSDLRREEEVEEKKEEPIVPLVAAEEVVGPLPPEESPTESPAALPVVKEEVLS